VPTAKVVRPPAVAGVFYPDDPGELRAAVDDYLDAAPQKTLEDKLVALICPHAGYVYSAPTAAVAYRLLRGRSYRRVVVLSPSHRVAFHGLAIPDCTAFATPLGTVPLWPGCRKLASCPPFQLDSRPHALEHAIEVHLPFLQRTLGEFELVPIVFGADERVLAPSVLLPLVDPETLWVVSTDLSHYLPYDAARDVDRKTLATFLSREAERVIVSDACGRVPAAALLALAHQLGWQIHLLDYRNSGDTAGDRQRVVGYAAMALTQSTAVQV
jgi:MEMO1 family protein